MVRVKNFLSIFAKNGQSNLVLVFVLVLESKGPYSVHPGFILSRARAIACCSGSCGPPHENVYMTHLQSWDKYNLVVIIYTHIQ